MVHTLLHPMNQVTKTIATAPAAPLRLMPPTLMGQAVSSCQQRAQPALSATGCPHVTFYKRRPRRPPFLRVVSVGIGVTSSMRPMRMPARARARRAAWAPGPGVLVRLPPVARSLMCKALIPTSLQRTTTSWAASIAAYGEASSRSALTFIPPVILQ